MVPTDQQHDGRNYQHEAHAIFVREDASKLTGAGHEGEAWKNGCKIDAQAQDR